MRGIIMSDDTKTNSDAADIDASPAASMRKERMLQLFKTLDKNSDDRLQPEELAAFLETIGYHPSAAAAEVDKILAQWDTDGDGTISFDEFLASQGSRRP